MVSRIKCYFVLIIAWPIWTVLRTSITSTSWSNVWINASGFRPTPCKWKKHQATSPSCSPLIYPQLLSSTETVTCFHYLYQKSYTFHHHLPLTREGNVKQIICMNAKRKKGNAIRCHTLCTYLYLYSLILALMYSFDTSSLNPGTCAICQVNELASSSTFKTIK